MTLCKPSIRKMRDKIKQVYQPRPVREKLFLCLFLVVLAFLWLSSWSGRLGEQLTAFGTAGREISIQDQWLENAAEIDQQLAQAIVDLDPAKTLAETQLVGSVDAIVREYDLSYSIDPPQSQVGQTFTFHSVRVRVNKAPLTDLLGFSTQLRTLEPYANLDRVTIIADRGNPSLLDAQIQISSVEMNPLQP